MYHACIILVSYQVSMSPATNRTYTACCCCSNCGGRSATLVRYPYGYARAAATAAAAAAATRGSTHLIVQNRVEEKHEITYLESRNQTKHAQYILNSYQLVSYELSMNQRFYKPCYCPCLLLLLLQMPPTSHESCRVRYQYGSTPAAAAAKCGLTHGCHGKLQSARR